MCYNELYFENGFISGFVFVGCIFLVGFFITFATESAMYLIDKYKQHKEEQKRVQEEQEDLERKRKAKEVNDYIVSHSRLLSLTYGIPRNIIIDIYIDIFDKLNEVEGKKK